MLNCIVQGLLGFISSYVFAIIFNAPRKDLIYCGITGGLTWFCYMLVTTASAGVVFGTFAAAMITALCSRFLSQVRRQPSTIYLIPGILPLVPGSGMYYTMTGIINGDMVYSYTKGVETFKLAGVIAMGIIMVFSLPRTAFERLDWWKLQKKK